VPSPESPLAGRVAVVTGGSRGIGAGVVRACAEDGAHVVIASRKLEACEALADEVTRRFGVRALPVAFNAGSWEQNDALAAAAYDEFGRVDILVNNAGMSPLYDDITSVTEALYDKVLDVNLRGPFRLTALVGSRMQQAGGGSVVNIGSSAAIRPDPFALPYSAAKAGLHVLSEGFAQLFGPSVRVNTVQPGPIRTDIAEHWADGAAEKLAESVAMQRCGEVDEVVSAVRFLASDAASYITGAVLRVDGGWR
jgi:NAD(P)-dependent dehydrogenase (short-subunit alcohol dehydrogenase family)